MEKVPATTAPPDGAFEAHLLQPTRSRAEGADHGLVDANARGAFADPRDSAADERERRADHRDAEAGQREHQADERERQADERERQADERERQADERETFLDDLARAIGVAKAGGLDRAEASLDRASEEVARANEAVNRLRETLRRARQRTTREQAEIDRETAEVLGRAARAGLDERTLSHRLADTNDDPATGLDSDAKSNTSRSPAPFAPNPLPAGWYDNGAGAVRSYVKRLSEPWLR
jgi:hypothetical protein